MKFTRLRSLVILFILLPFCSKADYYPRNHNADVVHYDFYVKLTDDNNVINGKATLLVRFLKDTSVFVLDLKNQDTRGMGMKVNSFSMDAEGRYDHKNDKVVITASNKFIKDQLVEIHIEYSGVPMDGLIISENKYGNRTFFSDNYPNRARHWIPCVDHLYEKATVDWKVEAPVFYQVVANGQKIEESNISRTVKLTHWKESAPIPPKVMVIGVAQFAVNLSGRVDGIPVEAWVYPENKEEGFYDYALAVKSLDWFIDKVGPYSYEKLANVQSKTRYGGMENASAIFYSESSVSGNRDIEGLVAHEVAHQWFGNSASENDWHHVWLSEGFATYFTHLYMEHFYGRDRMNERMKNDRSRVVSYFAENPAPIVNTNIRDYNKILNPNSYQKGGWVLHMLRREVGDDVFWTAIRAYYREYQNSNAMTSNLKEVFERVSGKDLDTFFDQWIFKAGHPVLDGTWEESKGNIVFKLKQTQSQNFIFPLDIQVIFEDGTTSTSSFEIIDPNMLLQIPVDKEVKEVQLDPDVWLLYDGTIFAK